MKDTTAITVGITITTIQVNFNYDAYVYAKLIFFPFRIVRKLTVM